MSSCETIRLIPGPQGPPGTNGTNGTDGVSAFTVTTADFTMPASLATVVVAVGDSSWMAVGEPLFVLGAGTLQVTALAAQSATLENLGYTENIVAGTVIPSGAQVTPSGWKGDKGDNGSTTGVLLAANNLSDVVSAATSRGNLGLGTMATQVATDYLTKAGNLAGLASAAASRTNLGLGSAAVLAAAEFLQTANDLSEIASAGAPHPANARANLGITGGILSIALLQQTAGGGGSGNMISGINPRNLNTEAFDPDNIVTISGGNFTLGAGSYVILALAPGYLCDRHQLTLYNGTADIALGGSAASSVAGGVQTTAFLLTRIQPSGGTTYTLRHYAETARAANGQGQDCTPLGTSGNVYAQVLILKQA